MKILTTAELINKKREWYDENLTVYKKEIDSSYYSSGHNRIPIEDLEEDFKVFPLTPNIDMYEVPKIYLKDAIMLCDFKMYEEDGKIRLKDLQNGNLADIEDEEFNDIYEVFDRLGLYLIDHGLILEDF